MNDGRIRVYIDFNDWWVGVYRAPHYWYVCPLPCIVIRARRPFFDAEEET